MGPPRLGRRIQAGSGGRGTIRVFRHPPAKNIRQGDVTRPLTATKVGRIGNPSGNDARMTRSSHALRL
jgi:hypothetical protein